jgi:hypothetical protein
MNAPTAKLAYDHRQRLFRGHVTRLKTLVAAHESEGGDSIHWGHVGDLGRVLELLAEAIEGLGGCSVVPCPPVKPGNRVRMLAMADPDPIAVNSFGTVILVTTGDFAQIQVEWDSGRTLALLPGVDHFEVVS